MMAKITTGGILHHQNKKVDAGIGFSATEESKSFWSEHICDTLAPTTLATMLPCFHYFGRKNEMMLTITIKNIQKLAPAK